MSDAQYRKHNDRSLNSSTYHKKDGTNVRAILKEEAQQEIDAAFDDFQNVIEEERKLVDKLLKEGNSADALKIVSRQTTDLRKLIQEK